LIQRNDGSCNFSHNLLAHLPLNIEQQFLGRGAALFGGVGDIGCSFIRPALQERHQEA